MPGRLCCNCLTPLSDNSNYCPTCECTVKTSKKPLKTPSFTLSVQPTGWGGEPSSAAPVPKQSLAAEKAPEPRAVVPCPQIRQPRPTYVERAIDYDQRHAWLLQQQYRRHGYVTFSGRCFQDATRGVNYARTNSSAAGSSKRTQQWITERIRYLESKVIGIPDSFPRLGKQLRYVQSGQLLKFGPRSSSKNAGQLSRDFSVFDQVERTDSNQLENTSFSYKTLMASASLLEYECKQYEDVPSFSIAQDELMFLVMNDTMMLCAILLGDRFSRIESRDVVLTIIPPNLGGTGQAAEPFDCTGHIRRQRDASIVSFGDRAVQSFLGEEVIDEQVYEIDELLQNFEIYSRPHYYKLISGAECSIRKQQSDARWDTLLEALSFVSDNPESIPGLELLKGNFVETCDIALAKASEGICTDDNADCILRNIVDEIRCGNSNLVLPNEAQTTAIKACLMQCITLVQGCPGSGKTYTSALIIKGLLELYAGRQVLCCAGSNTAADNLTLYLKRLNIPTVRIYASSREGPVFDSEVPEIKDCALHLIIRNGITQGTYVMMGEISQIRNDHIQMLLKRDTPMQDETIGKDIRCAYQQLERLEIQGARVVVSTCANSISQRVKDNYFAAVLIDETSQIIEPDIILPISIAPRHIVLVGDDKQLGPVVKNEVAKKAGLDRSLYCRLIQIGFKQVMLNTQYRMHPSLLTFPNSKFYDGMINSGVKAEDRVLPLRKRRQGLLSKVLRSNFPSFFWYVRGSEAKERDQPSYFNQQEIDTVYELVSGFKYEYNLQGSQIGVITPYKQQQNKLRDKFKAEPEIEVNSIDGFQGREKDVIIFSCVRSNTKGGVGFLDDYNRVNVALTRAKCALVLVGDFECFKMSKGIWKEIANFYADKGAVFVGDSVADLSRYDSHVIEYVE